MLLTEIKPMISRKTIAFAFEILSILRGTTLSNNTDFPRDYTIPGAPLGSELYNIIETSKALDSERKAQSFSVTGSQYCEILNFINTYKGEFHYRNKLNLGRVRFLNTMENRNIQEQRRINRIKIQEQYGRTLNYGSSKKRTYKGSYDDSDESIYGLGSEFYQG